MRFAVWLAILVGCADDHGPRLTSVAPAAAPRGARVTLTGERLCAANCATAGGKIQIGLALPATLATVIEYADDHAVIEIPSQAVIGSSEIVVTVNDQASNAIAFEVLAPF
jgi:hypothetical protein